jgi:DNA-binding CsgD family transcriptional regulator
VRKPLIPGIARAEAGRILGGMWASRAQAARRQIAALAAEGIDAGDLHLAALEIVARVVPFEQACWATVDPQNLVMTGVTNYPPWPVPQEWGIRFAGSEYGASEPHTFTVLARRDPPVARISEAPHRDVVRSVRLNDLLRPQGLEHELRAVFRVDGACWGVGGLFRDPGSDFTDREADFLSSITTTLGAATRLAVRARRTDAADGNGPVIVLVGPRGEIRAATPAAATWLTTVQDAAQGRLNLTLYAVVSGARAAPSGTASAQMRDPSGQWVTVQAARLLAGDDPEQMVVTIEPAASLKVARLMLTAYATTRREQDVCFELLAGRSTSEIADRLFISTHTVQDHLKSLFDKVGARNRSELVAKIHG